MLGNDISNRTAPVIAFNLDNLLFKDLEVSSMTTVQKIKYKMMSEQKKYLSRPVDKNFITSIDRLWNKYTYSVYFITFSDYVEDLYETLDKHNVNYTRLVKYDEWEELRRTCGLQYTYYFDNNLELLSYIGFNNALHIDMLPKVIL